MNQLPITIFILAVSVLAFADQGTETESISSCTKSHSKNISYGTETQIKDFLNKYEQEKRKTVYQHLFDKIGNKDEVYKILTPITK